MLVGVPILLVAIIILCAKSNKYIQDKTSKKSFKISLWIIAASTVLCLVFGTLGYLYIQHYQGANSACPSAYPYAWATLASGAAGIIASLHITVRFFKQKVTNGGLIMLAASILFVLMVFSALLASFFCLAF